MAIKRDTLDQLLDGRDPKEVFNKDGLFDELKKALAERVLNAELDDHLESEAPAGRRNHRNGHSKKTVLTETAKLDAGKAALDAFDAGPWGRKYPAIAQAWRRNWDRVIPFFAFPEAVRRI